MKDNWIWKIGHFLGADRAGPSLTLANRPLTSKRGSLGRRLIGFSLSLMTSLFWILWLPAYAPCDEPPQKNREAGPAFSFLTWGRVLLDTEQFSQAASYLEKEVENRPDSSEAYMLLGKAYWGMGRIKDARAAWEKAASLDPNCVPLVKARLARLNRLQDLIIISNEINAEERVPPFLVRDTLSSYFSNLGFKISPKLSGEFLARLTSTLEALAPPALEEIRKISNADILFLSEAVSYLEFQDPKEKDVKVIARFSAVAIDLHSYSKLGSYQTLRTAEAATLAEASEKALRDGGLRIAREILQQIAAKESLKPLLVANQADIVIPKLTYPQGSNIPIEITVHNQGDEEARNFEVQVLETSSDQKDKPIDSFLVCSLPPLSSVTFKVQWEAQRPGLQKIVVLVRPENKPKGGESDRHQSYQEVLILSPDEILTSLYRLASNYTPPGSPDRGLLQAQLRVALNPQDEPSLRNLLKAAVDPGETYVTVIGLGLRPWNIFSEEVAFPMAKRAARVDAQNWLALIRKTLGKGYVESVIPLKTEVYGARILLEQVLPDGSVMLKMHAPL